MDDSVVWALLAGLFVVTAMVLWTRSSLKKAVTEMGTQVQAASAPAQGLGPVVAGVNQAVANLSNGIGEIRTQAEKIATIGQQYERIEKQTDEIHSILVGSYRKGKAGEEALKHNMNEFIKRGWVKHNQPIGGGVVEYAILFNDGKMLAVDSKVVSTEELTTLASDKLSQEDRDRLAGKVREKVRKKIAEVEKYIDPERTLPLAVMAVPDSVMDFVADLIPEADDKKIILLGYSAVSQLISYFHRIHGFYAVKEEVAELLEKIESARQQMSRLNDKFFQGGFDKPLRTIENAVEKMKGAVLGARNALTFERRDTMKEPFELAGVEKEEQIEVPAST